MQDHGEFVFFGQLQLLQVKSFLPFAHGGLHQLRHEKIKTNFTHSYQAGVSLAQGQLCI